MSNEQEFEVIETMMFHCPSDWGRRVVKKADGEIMLQATDDKGKTWWDAPMPEFKLYFPEESNRLSTDNPYASLKVCERITSTFARTVIWR